MLFRMKFYRLSVWNCSEVANTTQLWALPRMHAISSPEAKSHRLPIWPAPGERSKGVPGSAIFERYGSPAIR